MSKEALSAPKKTTFYVAPSDLTVVTDPNDPLYDPRVDLPPDLGLVGAMLHYGWLPGSLVEAVKRGEQLVVVAGRQRVRAAALANAILDGDKEALATPGLAPELVERFAGKGTKDDRLRALVTVEREGKDEAASARLLGHAIMENALRRQDDPLTEARKIQQYLDRGRTETEAAVVFGCSVSSIKKKLTLLGVAPRVREALETGAITASDAIRAGLGNKPVEEQERILATIPQRSVDPEKSGADGRRKPEGRSKDRKPNRAKILSLIEHLGPGHNAAVAVSWALGLKDDAGKLVDDAALIKAYPATEAVLKARKRAKKGE